MEAVVVRVWAKGIRKGNFSTEMAAWAAFGSIYEIHLAKKFFISHFIRQFNDFSLLGSVCKQVKCSYSYSYERPSFKVVLTRNVHPLLPDLENIMYTFSTRWLGARMPRHKADIFAKAFRLRWYLNFSIPFFSAGRKKHKLLLFL